MNKSTTIKSDKYDLVCHKCGKYTNVLYGRSVCPDCKKAVQRACLDRRKSLLYEAYNNWLELINCLKFKPLTEADWIKSCEYFKGCACCGKPDIQARTMFIQHKLGGRYTPWNVIPTCATCNRTFKYMVNPFVSLDKQVSKCGGDSPEMKAAKNNRSLFNIVLYFLDRVEEWIDEQETKGDRREVNNGDNDN